MRDRIAPHLWQDNNRVIYDRLEFELARGVGVDGVGLGVNPQMMLRWSNDGGNTYSRELWQPVGRIGNYGLRVPFNRLGYGRDRVFWMRVSDPNYWGIVGAEFDIRACTS